MNKFKIFVISLALTLINAVSNANSLKNVELPLYTIEKEGKLSYIVGTTHNIPLDDIRAEIKEILTSQDYLIIEHFRSNGSELLRNENDKNWWNELSEDEQATLLKLDVVNVKNYKLDVVYLELLHWVSKKVRYESKNDQQINQQKSFNGVDDDLKNLYAEENIFALETTVEASKSLMESYSLNDMAKFKKYLMVIQILDSNDSDLKDYIIDAFSNLLQTKTTDTTKEKSYNNKVDDRNLLWIDRIENFHKNLNGKVLFAFGSGHLYSQQGILQLLEDRGFKITKLTFDSNQNNEYLSFWRDLFYLQSE